MTRLAARSPWLRLAVCFVLVSLLAAWPTSANDKAPADARLFGALPLRCIGPANMGGRICDLAVVESNPDIIYVAAASGGLWKTTDAGASWKPVFDDQPTGILGAVAVAPSNPDIVWVGTGEANARNSVSWGDGVYRSLDGGKTWQHLGLKESHHIGRIVIHPKNPDIVYVAALGHLWGSNKERGLYKTSDGGKTWNLSKYIDDETGFIDVAIDPTEPDTLYAAAYRVRRDGFSGGNPAVQLGDGAGLYRTTDGGRTWEKMANGLPKGPYGRCGIEVYRKDPRIVYAVVQASRTPVTVKGGLPNGTLTIEAGGVFRSEDRGQTWKHVNTVCPRPFYYGQIRIDPSDDQRVYVLGTQFFTSSDGGRSFRTGPKGVHPDHHALWINPRDGRHLVLGNDGGLYFSKNRGQSWQPVRGMALGQFYGIAVDMSKPYRVYGGLQDNGSWGGSSATRTAEGITLADWKRVGTGDGFYCQADPTDPNTIYAEMQYGKGWRINAKSGAKKLIQPKSAKGESVRWNWSTPILLSPHDAKTLFYAGNYLFRSDNRGDSWAKISPDLTGGKPGQKSTGHTITTIAESPRKSGLLWAGTDDGKLHVTRDGGKTWTDLSDKVPGVPPDRWITRVECSHFEEGTAYLTIGRHRNDDRRPYLFKTTDHGNTWKPLVSDLPADSPLHVVRESSRNRDLLFAGTEHALFVSRDGGGKWQRVPGLPPVPVHDLVIHPRERDLVIGTHGRSVWVVDVAPLEQLTGKALTAEAHLFEVRPAVAFEPRKTEPALTKAFVGSNPPFGATIYYHLKNAAPGPVSVTILDGAGKPVATLPGSNQAGLQRVVWDLRRAGAGAGLVAPGEYVARLQAGAVTLTRPVRVEAGE